MRAFVRRPRHVGRVLLMTILLALPGCLEISYEIDLERNGSADVLIKMRPMPGVPITMEELREELAGDLEGMRNRYPGWEDFEFVGRGEDYVGIRFHVDDLSLLSSQGDSDSWAFVEMPDGNYRFAFGGIEPEGTSVTVITRLPGEVLDTDGNRRGSREVEWHAAGVGRLSGWAEVEPSSGLGPLVWLLLVGVVAVAAVGVVREAVRRRDDPAGNTGAGSFCTSCGAPASPAASFCEQCGQRFET